jgi:hypothetical protein
MMLLLVSAYPVAGQHGPTTARPAGSGLDAAIGAHVVPLVTHVSPILNGESRSEAYLTQPTLLAMASALGGALRLNAAVSLEGLTLDRGELGAGAHGEGYVDRRHPHTYLHELVVSAQHRAGNVAGSLSAGRGFVPFGTDDPMMRPFVKFPVNHHLGQILERLVVVGGLRVGAVLAEGASFGGNEPTDAEDVGSLDRFGDSWSARLTVYPVRGVEIQASRAWVTSPEIRIGGGWDQRKWSASVRYDRDHARGAIRGLVEWNRTTQVDRGTRVFSFGSVLAEAELEVDGWRPAIRLERVERPEEQRLSDPFRTPWPHGGGHVLGITQWHIAGARIERSISAGALRIAPFVEGSISHVTETADGLFDPSEFYGANTLWTFNVGARVRAGWHPSRMGRYGVADPIAAPAHEH